MRVDSVVWFGVGGCDTCGAKVCPCALLHGGGGGQTNSRGLRPESRDTVVNMIFITDFDYIRGLVIDLLLAMCHRMDLIWKSLTQRSHRPSILILEQSGNIAPTYVHGPVILGAEWIAIFPPVENRKYFPSESRRIMEGSWALLHTPEHFRGSAYAAAYPDRASGSKIPGRIIEEKNIGWSSRIPLLPCAYDVAFK